MDVSVTQHARPLQELALHLEAELAARLAGVSLVLEGGLDDHTFARVEELVARVARVGNGPPFLVQRLPATLLFHLVGCGSRMKSDAFWPTAALGGRFDQTELGEGFERAIRRFGLETFPALVDERALRFVAPILAHGGIPRYAADRYVDLVVSTVDRFGMQDASEVVAFWRSRRTSLDLGQRPIRRFLLHGGEPALDYLDRTIEMARLDPDDAKVSAARELGLPEHIVEAYVRQAQHPGARPSVRRRRAILPRPTVRLDPFEAAGPFMDVPAVPPTVSRGTWTIDDGEGIKSYRTSTIEGLRIPLAPAMSWSAELRTDEGAARTLAFEALEQSPYVLFDPRTGLFVDDLRPVTLATCWILATEDCLITAQDASGAELRLSRLSELPKPGGKWHGYLVHHLDIENASTLTLQRPGAAAGQVRVISASSRPRAIGEPAAGIATADGLLVYASPPAIYVPWLADVTDDRWLVSLLSGEGRVVKTLSEIGVAGTDVPLDPLMPRSGLGVMELTVRGPLGLDLHHRFAVVPGIQADVPRQVLLPGDEVGRSVEVRADASVELSDALGVGRPGRMRAAIPSDGDRIFLAASRGTARADLAVGVPRLQWAVRGQGTQTQLGTACLRIDADDLIEGRVESLVISTVLPGRSVALALTTGDRDLQRLPTATTASPGGRWAFALAAFRDTVRTVTSPRMALVLEVDKRGVPVAEVVATADVTDIHASLVEDQVGRRVRVTFTQGRKLSDTVVRLWSLTRPWEPPIQVLADGGTSADFPVAAVPVGHYRVEVAIHDPWFTPRRPVAGAAGSIDVDLGSPSELLEADLELERSSDLRDRISLVLATRTAPADLLRLDASPVWSELAAAVRALMADVVSDTRADAPLRALVAWMAADPLVMLRALAKDAERDVFSPADMLRLYLIAAPQLRSRPVASLEEGVLRSLWRSCPPFAAMVDVPAAQSGNHEAISRCEEQLGWRPDGEPPPVGKAPRVAELSLDAARQAMLRDVLGLVPTSLLSWDSYQLACFQWLAACRAEPRRARSWADSAQVALETHSFGSALDPYVEARRGLSHPDFGWADGLRASLACAAHVVANDRYAIVAARALDELLAFSPLLVTHDLVLAEALLSPADATFLSELIPRSEAIAETDSAWRRVLHHARSGTIVTATVTHVTDEGSVMVDIDGIRGRVKPRERGWSLVERDRLLAPGDNVEVIVTGLDPTLHRVDASMRRAQPSPWLQPGRRQEVGDIVDVTVTAVTPFGIFGITDSGVEGLIHVSQLPDDDLPDAGEDRVRLLAERYPVNGCLRVKVMDIDAVAERMSLVLAR